MPIALISSLYRCERHLPAFSAALFGFARQISESGVHVHYLPIVNDATPGERQRINELASEINARYYGRMTPHFVPRESLYASWNRGLAASDAPYFSFWNADDFRSAEAFREGYAALQSGVDLVDFEYTRVGQVKRFGFYSRRQRIHVPCMFIPGQRADIGPFFMARRLLYDRVGPFDRNFQVAGDTEWAGRAAPFARFQRGIANGGDFVVHGDNLSNTGGEREAIEVNVISLRLGYWGRLKPANPRAMRQAWESWGNCGELSIPPEAADFLWGADAEKRWRRFQSERRQGAALRRLRLSLAARGLLRSVEWETALRGRDRK